MSTTEAVPVAILRDARQERAPLDEVCWVRIPSIRSDLLMDTIAAPLRRLEHAHEGTRIRPERSPAPNVYLTYGHTWRFPMRSSTIAVALAAAALLATTTAQA